MAPLFEEKRETTFFNPNQLNEQIGRVDPEKDRYIGPFFDDAGVICDLTFTNEGTYRIRVTNKYAFIKRGSQENGSLTLTRDQVLALRGTLLYRLDEY